MIEKLRVSRSATFYRARRNLSKAAVENVFKDVSSEKIGRYIENSVRTNRRFGSTDVRVSFLVFKFCDAPSFLVSTKLRELKYAYLLILEIQDVIVVLKKNISGLETLLKKYANKLDYGEIQYLFADEETSYEKITTSTMGISKVAISRKTVEANDLRGQIAAQSSRRAIPTTTTIRTAKHRHTLRPNSSSVSKIDVKSDIDQILEWAIEVCNELSAGRTSNTFLDSFAKPVNFNFIREKPLVPTALYLNLTELKDKLEEGANLFFRDKPLRGSRAYQLLTALESVFLIESDGRRNFISHFDGRLTLGELRVNVQSLTIASRWLKSLAFRGEDGELIDLARYINSKQLFTVTFDSPEFIYITRKIFRDSGISSNLSEVTAALNSVIPNTLLSEKGEPHMPEHTGFHAASVFGHLETSLRESGSVLICDDFGDEWSDYLEFSVERPKIRLLHCKHALTTTSATRLHDVVSQALKNLGRVSFSEADIDRKIKTWGKAYKCTSINRIRSGHSQAEVRQRGLEIMQSPELEREIGIVVPFVSKRELLKIQCELGAGTKVDNHVPQMIWLLSTFVFACKENGIQPKIYCSE